MPDDAQAALREPLSSWSAATLAFWCAAQGEQLRTSRVDVGRLLSGVTGAELLRLTDAELDELGVPSRMRAYLRDKLVYAQATPATVDEQLLQAETQGRTLRETLRATSSRRDLSEATGARAPSEADSAPLLRAPTPPGRMASAAVGAVAGALAATTAFMAVERRKREAGQATTSDALSTTSVTLPYQWAASSANFGLEWVRKALEVGEGVPMVGACFTLCLIVAQSAEQAMANKSAAGELGNLAVRVATVLAGAEEFTLQRVAPSVGLLQAALREVVELVQAYSTRGWLRRLASAGGDAQRFKSLHVRVREEMAALSFDLQLSTPAFRDESKALRCAVLEATGRTVEQGGLAELLGRPGGAEVLRDTLGVDAQVLSAEVADLARTLERVQGSVEAHLSLSLSKELRGAIQLNVQLTQPSKRSAGGATFLQQAVLREGFTGTQRRVAAFRVLAGHAVECALSVDSRDNTELRVKAIERVQQVEAFYEPAARAMARRRCCGGAAFAGLVVPQSCCVFQEEDVEIPPEQPRQALLRLTLPDDAGPQGEVLTLRLRLWVSFHPAPALGLGFELGKTVPVVQTLFLAVFKKGSSRLLVRDIEDVAAKHRAGVVALGAPVLALPLLIHNRYLAHSESLLKRQLVGWADGTAIELA